VGKQFSRPGGRKKFDYPGVNRCEEYYKYSNLKGPHNRMLKYKLEKKFVRMK
jgi:hypothetical protein